MGDEIFQVRKLQDSDEEIIGSFLVPAITKHGQIVDLELPFIEIQQIYNQLVDQMNAAILASK